MGRFTGKSCRMSTMFVLTLGFFLVEVIFGYLTRSMALIADSFHMLSDLLAMIVAFACMKISKRRHSSRNTFGWVRAEVLGALFNTVFLVALAFSIVMESIKRFFEPETLVDPKKVLIVGALGLGVNIVGLFLFHGHGGHGHSHGGTTGGGSHSHSVKESSTVTANDREEHGHSHSTPTDSQVQHRQAYDFPHQDDNDSETNGHRCIREPDQTVDRNTAAEGVHRNRKRSSQNSIRGEELAEYATTTPQQRQDVQQDIARQNDVAKNEDPSTNSKESKKNLDKRKVGGVAAQQMNMRGVWLHVMGDAFGSVVVIINAVLNMEVDNYFLNHYLDPMLSLIMALIIIGTSLPLLKDSALILLQTVPKDINVQDIKKRLLEQFGQIIADIHEFHVWCLSGNKIVATAHVRFNGDMDDYVRLGEKMKEFFHDEGMHSTTIQLELVRGGRIGPGAKYCALKCPKKSTGERQCADEEVCCVIPPSPSLEVVTTTRTNSSATRTQPVSPPSSTHGTKPTSADQFSFSENRSSIDEMKEDLHM